MDSLSTTPKPFGLYRWERAEPWLKAALAYDARNIPVESIRDAFLAGRYFLLDGVESALLFEFSESDGRPQLNIYLAGGELDELLAVLLPRAEALGTYRGCEKAFVAGRRGWVKVLKSRGYTLAGRNDLGDWIVAKPLSPQPFHERVKPMTAINYSLSPSLVALATDTLVTDARDWWPATLTPKAAFLPHLDGLITSSSFMALLRDTYNFALTAPVENIEEQAPLLPRVCQQAVREALALCTTLHEPSEDWTWADQCTVSLFGWSEAQNRLVGFRFRFANGFAPELMADGVYTHPLFEVSPVSVTPENILALCNITVAQHQEEARILPNEQNGIGGNILLWELRASADGCVRASVQNVFRFPSRTADLEKIQGRLDSKTVRR